MDGTMDFVTPPPEPRYDSQPPQSHSGGCSAHLPLVAEVIQLRTQVSTHMKSAKDATAKVGSEVSTLNEKVTQLQIHEATRDLRLGTIENKVTDVSEKQDETIKKLDALILKVAIWTSGGIIGGGSALYGIIQAYKAFKGG